MHRLATLDNDRGERFFAMSYNAERNYLYCDWSGYVVRQDIITGAQQMIDWARANARRLSCVAVVNDNRRLRGSWETGIGWLDEHWNPAMYVAGVRGNAIVMSPDLISQVSAEALAATSREGVVTTRVVPSLQAAEEWVAELQQATPQPERAG